MESAKTGVHGVVHGTLAVLQRPRTIPFGKQPLAPQSLGERDQARRGLGVARLQRASLRDRRPPPIGHQLAILDELLAECVVGSVVRSQGFQGALELFGPQHPSERAVRPLTASVDVPALRHRPRPHLTRQEILA
jgi:hypothetical protein